MTLDWLFPYRAHMQAEIGWLKDQLAQKQRRVDELQDALIQASKREPAVRIQYRQETSGKMVPVQPRGWDEYRAAKRSQQEAEPAEEGDNNAIPS